MTVCKTCNGLGKIKLMPFGYICTCAECKGTGETRDYMTNEEWFCQLSTSEKARVLADNKLYFRMLDYDGFVEWLKGIHK